MKLCHVDSGEIFKISLVDDHLLSPLQKFSPRPAIREQLGSVVTTRHLASRESGSAGLDADVPPATRARGANCALLAVRGRVTISQRGAELAGAAETCAVGSLEAEAVAVAAAVEAVAGRARAAGGGAHGVDAYSGRALQREEGLLAWCAADRNTLTGTLVVGDETIENRIAEV